MNKIVLFSSAMTLALALFACTKSVDEGGDGAEKIPQPKIEAKGAPAPMTAEQLYSMKRIGELALSPASDWAVYVLRTPSIQDNKIYADLYATKIDGSETKQLTDDKYSDMNPVWSPDGKKIAFLSNREIEKGFQAFVMDFPSGTPKRITDAEGGVSNLAWSPDGKYLSFTSDVKIDKTPADKYPNYSKAKIRIYGKLPVRHWDEWIDENYSHLFIIPADGGEAKDLMPGEAFDTPLKPFGGAEEIAWSPDGKEIAYTCKKDDNFALNTNSEIFIVTLNDFKTKVITTGMMGYEKAPLYSPDGKYIAFTSQERPGFESDRIRVMLYDRATGKIDELTKNLDQWVEEKIWAPDSKAMYASVTDSGCVQIHKLTVDGAKDERVTKGWYNHGSGIGITKDGKTLVFGRQSMTQPLDICTMPATGGEVKQITSVNAELLKTIKPAIVQQRNIKSSDGKNIFTWVILPPDFDSTKKYPMISYNQGGPQSMIDQNFHYRWNFALMASRGYVIVAANRRGVPGFGQEWNDAISKDWGGKPMQDLLDAADAVAKESWIDKNGMASMGASAGGYAAFWMEGNSKGRFKAIVAHCGVFNLESMYGSTEELFFPNWENGGPYWEGNNKAYYDKHSPHRYVANWNTPILISTGERDYRVPYTQSLEAFTAAQVKGIPSELIVFPEENHFISHAQEFIVWHNEVFNFLNKYCRGGASN
ncbi:MAG: prolyl oligopeptidase family serine peptidase [Chloroflexota bacterium]